MDDLTDNFGQLSTTAKEWKPASTNRSISFGATSDRSYSSAGATSFGSGGGHPLSPHSPARGRSGSGALHSSPPGRTAWQTQQSSLGSSSGEWPGTSSNAMSSPYGATNKWVGAQQQQPPAWPDVSASQDQLHQQQHLQDYPDEPWQQQEEDQSARPLSIPVGPPPPPAIRSLHAMGMPDDLWRYHRDLSFESQREMDMSDPRHKAIPPNFTSAFPLDADNARNRSSFGYPMAAYKVVSREDGHLYCLRRADNVRSVSHKIASTVSEQWATAIPRHGRSRVVEHPGLVRFYRCFVAHRAVFFVHQYCPGAQTLRERFFRDSHSNPMPLPEPVVWSCLTQLVAAIRCVHGGNLACRTLHLNHIICHGGGGSDGRLRVRINCLGVVDALEFEARKSVEDLQLEDLRDLGRLILSLATGTEVTKSTDGNTIRRCDMFVTQTCSPELHHLIVQLLLPTNVPPPIYEISNMISNHAMEELELQQVMLDRTEAALSAEYDSGRALRLLLKMGFVNERPELGMNRRWTESGDCYVLKLFRDYVFHQADEGGNPVIDLGHIITSLNKLDAAEEEQIVLASRDGKTLMVVSYGDIARSLEKAYGELCNGAVLSRQSLQY